MTRAHSVIIIISLEGSLGDGGMEGEKKKKGGRKEGGDSKGASMEGAESRRNGVGGDYVYIGH